MRDLTAQRHSQWLAAQPFDSHPVVAPLTTEHDRRSDRLRAGQALEQPPVGGHGARPVILPVAPAEGVARPAPRREPVPHLTGHAQMLIRLGYGPQGPGHSATCAGSGVVTLDDQAFGVAMGLEPRPPEGLVAGPPPHAGRACGLVSPLRR